MSRGAGAVQRSIMTILDKGGLIDTIEIAARVFDVLPGQDGVRIVTESQVVSVRRALGNLKRQGKAADLGRGWRGGRRHWATPARVEQYHQRVKAVFG
jgi:hypothetical protein